MKAILILSLFSIFVGAKSSSLRWPQIAVIALFVAALVGWQTANILFRYIGVE